MRTASPAALRLWAWRQRQGSWALRQRIGLLPYVLQRTMSLDRGMHPSLRSLKRIALQILEIGGIPSALRRANVSNIYWRLLCEYGRYMIAAEPNLKIHLI